MRNDLQARCNITYWEEERYFCFYWLYKQKDAAGEKHGGVPTHERFEVRTLVFDAVSIEANVESDQLIISILSVVRSISMPEMLY